MIVDQTQLAAPVSAVPVSHVSGSGLTVRGDGAKGPGRSLQRPTERAHDPMRRGFLLGSNRRQTNRTVDRVAHHRSGRRAGLQANAPIDQRI